MIKEVEPSKTNFRFIEVIKGTNKILKFCLPSEQCKILLELREINLKLLNDRNNEIDCLKGLICKSIKSNYFISFTLSHMKTSELTSNVIYNIELYGVDLYGNIIDFEYYRNKELKIFVKDKIYTV